MRTRYWVPEIVVVRNRGVPPCAAISLFASVDRNGRLVRDRTHDGSFRVEQLDDGVGFGEGWRAVATTGRRPVVAEPRDDARIVRALQQEPVGLGAQFLLGADVRGVHASDDHDRERRPDEQQQPKAQAHAARTVYPTPRIV